MATTTPASRLDNIEKSVDVFIQVNIETGLSQTVYYKYQPVPASVDLPARCVISNHMLLGDVSQHQAGRGTEIHRRSVYQIDFTLLERAETANGGVANRYTLGTLAQNIKDLFEEGEVIAIRDYNAMGTPVVGYLKAWESPQVVPVNENQVEGIRRVDVRAPMQYVHIFNRT